MYQTCNCNKQKWKTAVVTKVEDIGVVTNKRQREQDDAIATTQST